MQNEPVKRDWWSRNWKWFVPLGCGTVVLMGVATIALFVFLIFSTLKSSDPSRGAVEIASRDPRAVEALGTPIEPGWWISGSINQVNDRGSAELTIPVKGPKGKGRLYVEASRQQSEWTFTVIRLDLEGRAETIDLLE